MGRADRHASRQLRSLSVKTRRWVAPAAALTVLVASCSGGSTNDDAAPTVSLAPANPTTTTADPATTTTAPPTTTTTTPIPTDEEQIDALIERYWQVVFAANNPPDPDYPGWDEVATPRLAEGRRARSAENLQNNRGIAPLEPDARFNLGSVVTVLDGQAIGFHCFRDFAYGYELDTGEVLGEARVVSLVRVEVVETEVGWRLRLVDPFEHWRDGEEAACVEALESYS